MLLKFVEKVTNLVTCLLTTLSESLFYSLFSGDSLSGNYHFYCY